MRIPCTHFAHCGSSHSCLHRFSINLHLPVPKHIVSIPPSGQRVLMFKRVESDGFKDIVLYNAPKEVSQKLYQSNRHYFAFNRRCFLG